MTQVEDDVSNLIARAKAGDEAALRAFLTRFGSELRMMVRARLPRQLRSQYDSGDFVQAIWQSFFAEFQHGALNFERTAALSKVPRWHGSEQGLRAVPQANQDQEIRRPAGRTLARSPR